MALLHATKIIKLVSKINLSQCVNDKVLISNLYPAPESNSKSDIYRSDTRYYFSIVYNQVIYNMTK